jgi:hypothetical protein
MTESAQLINLSIQMWNWDRPQEYWAFGVWERNEDGQDGKVEVYLPRHRDKWDIAFGAEFGYNPDGLEQTKVVLPPDKVHFIPNH